MLLILGIYKVVWQLDLIIFIGPFHLKYSTVFLIKILQWLELFVSAFQVEKFFNSQWAKLFQWLYHLPAWKIQWEEDPW